MAGVDETVSHFVGPRMDISGRIIQRCTVCGEKLCDSRGVMVMVSPNGSVPDFATFPEGRVVQMTVDQNPTRITVMPDSDRLPADACIALVE